MSGATVHRMVNPSTASEPADGEENDPFHYLAEFPCAFLYGIFIGETIDAGKSNIRAIQGRNPAARCG